MAPDVKNACLICGDDEYRVEREVKRLLDALVPPKERDYGLEKIDGRVENVSDTLSLIRRVLQALQSDGLFSTGNKTVYLREPSFISTDRIARSEAVKGALEPLVKRIKEGLPDGTRLIVSAVKYNGTLGFVKAFSSKNATMIELGKNLNAKDKLKAAEALVKEIAAELGLQMNSSVTQLFLARVGKESRLIVSELEKLACYCGENRNVSEDDVNAIVSSGAVSEIWGMLDAFADRNVIQLVKEIRIQFEQGENAIRLITSVIGTLNSLIYIREALDRSWLSPSGSWSLPEGVVDGLSETGKDPRSLGGFQFKKLLRQASNWTLRELRAARVHIMKLREELVSTGLPDEFLFETRLIQALGTKRAKR